MTHDKQTLAVAVAAAVGLLAPVQAMSAALAPGQFASSANSTRHPIVFQCYWKKVCVRWVSHFNCAEWTQQKVCNPALMGSKQPPSGPKQIRIDK